MQSQHKANHTLFDYIIFTFDGMHVDDLNTIHTNTHDNQSVEWLHNVLFIAYYPPKSILAAMPCGCFDFVNGIKWKFAYMKRMSHDQIWGK